MFKYVLIVNGLPRSGKTTFENIVAETLPTRIFSSIDPIKKIATVCGYSDDHKTERDRKFLSDLKALTTEYSDLSFVHTRHAVTAFNLNSYERIMFIDIREPEEIERAVKEFGAKTVFIENKNVKPVLSNSSDARVEEYTYDYIVKNNGTLEEFRSEIARFIARVIWDSIE